MQSRAFLVWLLLPGCGLVSGLDKLHAGDAGADDDATIDDASGDDASSSSDAAIDVVTTTSDAAIDGAGIRCGPTQTCTGNLVCCVSPGSTITYTCAKDGCNGSTTFVLKCDDKSDCTNTAGQVCCLSGNTASCGPSSGSCAVLCIADSQCGTGTKCVPFDAGAGLALSKCQ